MLHNARHTYFLLQLLIFPLFVYVVVIIEGLVVRFNILSLMRSSLTHGSSWPLRTRMRLNEIRRCFTVICTRVRRQCHPQDPHFKGLTVTSNYSALISAVIITIEAGLMIILEGTYMRR